MRRLTVAVGLAGCALLGTVATAGTTFAAVPIDPDAVQVVELGSGGGELLPLQVDRLYPGAGAHARFLLERGSSFTGGTFAVSVESLEDYERGCNRPEGSTGDTSCGGGPDQGELSRQLLVGHAWTPAAGCDTAPVPTSGETMRSLAGTPLLAPDSLSEGDAACLVIALLLPVSADNLVQTDQVRFDLRLGLQDAALVLDSGTPIDGEGPNLAASGPDPDPDARPDEQPGADGQPGGQPAAQPAGQPGSRPVDAPMGSLMTAVPTVLPFTGGPITALLLVGPGVLAAGAAVQLSGRRARH